MTKMEISKSIFGLAKSNNGFFKSEKQAQFLISQLIDLDGFVGYVDSGYNSCPIFANWDKKGITKLFKSAKNGSEIMFERKEEGVLTFLEIKEVKRLERKIKSIQKEIDDRQFSFDNGSYNGSGDFSTYSNDMIARFKHYQSQKIEQINKLREKLCELKK